MSRLDLGEAKLRRPTFPETLKQQSEAWADYSGFGFFAFFLISESNSTPAFKRMLAKFSGLNSVLIAHSGLNEVGAVQEHRSWGLRQ